mmetsp:Transcript_17295/g.49113  ORF Transcript_17295/g.49113 Transcript_17295/m.49113 type:complete len:231 (+) Transcript_17295:846-1538(+)
MAQTLEHDTCAQKEEETELPEPDPFELQGWEAELAVQVRRVQQRDCRQHREKHRGHDDDHLFHARGKGNAFEDPFPLVAQRHDQSGAHRELRDVAAGAAHEAVKDEEVVRRRDQAHHDRRGDRARAVHGQCEEHEPGEARARHEAVRREDARGERPKDQGDGLHQGVDAEVINRRFAVEACGEGRAQGAGDIEQRREPVDDGDTQKPLAQRPCPRAALAGQLQLPLHLFE